MSTHKSKIENKRQLADMEHLSGLLSYPIDMSLFLALPPSALDATGASHQEGSLGYHPTMIVQYALAHWNEYLSTGIENHRQSFLTQTYWLIEHEVCIG